LFLAVLLCACATANLEANRAPSADVAAPNRPSRQAPEVIVEVDLPRLPKDASCRRARAAYVERWQMLGAKHQADVSRGQFGAVLGRGSYFDHCRVPPRYEVSICAAVQHGQVLGATVSTRPRARRLERCIDGGVRKLAFPVSPRMDVTRTVFQSAD